MAGERLARNLARGRVERPPLADHQTRGAARRGPLRPRRSDPVDEPKGPREAGRDRGLELEKTPVDALEGLRVPVAARALDGAPHLTGEAPALLLAAVSCPFA